MEYELLDTGVFDDDRYFDVFVEYAKASPEDILVRCTVSNRGPAPPRSTCCPTLWFRNTWSWGERGEAPIRAGRRGSAQRACSRSLPRELGDRYLYCEGDAPCCSRRTTPTRQRISASRTRRPWVKDGFNHYIVDGEAAAVNPADTGTKAAAHYGSPWAPGGVGSSSACALDAAPDRARRAYSARRSPTSCETRRAEADDFYASITPPKVVADGALVMRQALAGMLWSKQFYYYDVSRWLKEHGLDPLHLRGAQTRNASWPHLVNAHVISMPDKWEYPWYAAWDLAFHVLSLAMVDRDFAKQQLLLMLEQRYLHPSGQIPAYEWNFGDVNPPVHAWATWSSTRARRCTAGAGRHRVPEGRLPEAPAELHLVGEPQGPRGQNVFEGGFLGLDNIGVFDRSAPLPTGGSLEQADGTAWMAFYAQCMLQLASSWRSTTPCTRTSRRSSTSTSCGSRRRWTAWARHADELWDEHDGFFYDVLRLPDGQAVRLKVRSMVGLLSLCASTVFRPPASISASRCSGTACARSPRRYAGPDREHHARRPPRARQSPSPRAGHRRQAAAGARLHAGRERVPEPVRPAVAVSRSIATTRTRSPSTARCTGSTTSRPSR